MSSSGSSSSSKSSDDDKDRDFRFPLRMRPTKKYNLADEATLSQILSKIPGRPRPEFQGKEYLPPGENKDKLLFKCEEPNCTAAFANKVGLKSHQVWHRDRKLRCPFCDLTFKLEEELTRHVDEFHPDLEENPDANPLQCKKCGRIPRDRRALWRHVRDSHPGPPIPCTICGVLFKRPDNLKEHMKSKHPPEGTTAKKFPCDICKKDYAYSNSLRLHIKKMHRGKTEPIRCVLCNTSYGCKVSYNHHMQRHTNPKFFPCEICEVKFRNRTKLKRHFDSKSHKKMERKAKKKAPNPNQVKPVVLYEVNNKKRHENKAGRRLSNAELIELCRKSIVKVNLHRVDQDQVDLVRSKSASHAAVAPSQKVRKYQHLDCTYCRLRLGSLEDVNKHEVICLTKKRTGKLVICPKCNKEFDRPSMLEKHMRSHSEERPHQCSFCKNSFKCEESKKMHEKRIHFGIRYERKVPRVFSCNFAGCQKKYCSGEMLRIHIGSFHLGKRYPCQVCGKKFKGKNYLSVHMRFVHVQNPTLLLCRTCNRAYKTRLAMLNHFKTRRHRLKVREMRQKLAKTKELPGREARSIRLQTGKD